MDKGGTKHFLKLILSSSIVISVLEGASKVITLLLLPLFSKYLSPEDFGIFTLVVMVTTFLGLFYNPGITSATVRLFHDTVNEEKRKELIGSLYVFYIFTPLALSILLTLIGPYIFPLIFKDFNFFPYGFLAIVLSFFMQVKNTWSTYLILNYKIKVLSIYVFISVLIGLLVAYVLVVIMKMGALGRVLAMLPPAIFLFIVSIITLSKYSGGKWSYKSIMKQLKFGLPLAGAVWSTSLLLIADRYILEIMTDVSSVGIYAFAFQIGQIPLFFVIGIQKLWSPMFYENMNNNNFTVVKNLILFFSFALSAICVVLMLFTYDFFFYFIDDRYYSAIPIVHYIVYGVFFSGLIVIPNTKLGYLKKFGLTSKIALFSFGINVILNIILIPYLNVIGAAIATFISYMCYFIIGLIKTNKNLNSVSDNKFFLTPLFFITLTLIYGVFYENTPTNLKSLILKLLFLLIMILSYLKIVKVNLKTITNLFEK